MISPVSGPRGWSPFARARGRRCAVAGEALLRAAEHAERPLAQLTPTAYDQVRRSRPELALPRTATVASACGGWDRALREAEKHASEMLRQR
jgi:hypothetical protein